MILATISFVSYGQTYLPEGLSSNAKTRIQQKVGQLTDYISYMADRNNQLTTREYYKKEALMLFCGEGERFQEPDDYGNLYWRDPVVMETTSKRYPNNPPKRQEMKGYFTNLCRMQAYSEIIIESTQWYDMKVSELKPYSEGKYECTVEFVQWFTGKKDDKIRYSDATRKKVKVYLNVINTPEGYELMILLGDVYAMETTDIDKQTLDFR